MEVEILHCESSTMARDLISHMNGGVLEESKSQILESLTGVGSDVWVGLFDGVPVCAWGLVPPSLISDRAYLWLHVTEGVEGNKFMFIRWSQRVVEELKRLYPTIYGVCEEDNARAIRWMKLLGAEFSYPHGGRVPFVIEAKHG